MTTLQDKATKIIEYLFYALFFITPFAMTNVNHELFEFNKMWLVFTFASLIFFFWGLKMISSKHFFVRRTPLDIPILLFLASQIISTIFSLDPHTSFWGYYSRFNGGLLSTITYIFLYYALITNFFSDKERAKSFVKKVLGVSIISGFLVTLWGLPSHFGYDPTCLIFGQGFNTGCWTAAFDPTARIFSTLGQPNWLAAYLSILLPIAIAFLVTLAIPLKTIAEKAKDLKVVFLTIAIIAFYIAILWTNSQSGFLGLWGGLLVFIGIIKLVAIRKFGLKPAKLLNTKSLKLLLITTILFLITTFFIGNPFPKLQNFSFEGITKNLTPQNPTNTPAAQTGPALEYNITGSGDIRLIVWRGALDIFLSRPIFGTGVETFASAYYKHRPAEHNLTSEWDYLYNKAHNEYLNFLATTGIVGLGTYLFLIILFLVIATKYFLSQKTVQSSLIPASLIGAYVSILISNFFGFSVVMVNLYFFLIPAFFFLLSGKKERMISYPKTKSDESYQLSDFTPSQILILLAIAGITLYNLWFLLTAWRADKAYALGYNYNKIEEFVAANKYLEKAVDLRPGEDLFKNELSANLATLAVALAQEDQTDQAVRFAQRAKELSDQIVRDHPNNVVYYKARTRVLYTLAQLQPELLKEAYGAIQKAAELAPTDAKVLYNKALFEEMLGMNEKALDTLNKTIKLKQNYDEPRIRKAVLLISMADNENNTEKATNYRKEARQELQYILDNISPQHPKALELLKTLE